MAATRSTAERNSAYTAEHGVLQLPANIPKATRENYLPKQKEWRDWCAEKSFDTGELVNGEKLLLFVKERVLKRYLNKRQRSQTRAGPNPRIRYASSFATVESYLSAVILLYRLQCSAGTNHFSNPRGEALKRLLQDHFGDEIARRKERIKDRALDSIQNSFDVDKLEDIVRTCWAHRDASNQTYESYLRTCTDIFLGWHLLLRREDSREIDLADVFGFALPQSQGSTRCTCLAILTQNSGPDSIGQRQYVGCIRHRKVLCCAVSQLAFYLFFRWNFELGPVPSFQHREQWQFHKLFLGENHRNFKALLRAPQAQWTNDVFDRAGLGSLKKTYAARINFHRSTGLQGVPEEEIRKAGRWTNDTIINESLSHLPMESIREGAGFDRSGQSDYFLERATVQPPQGLIQSFWPWVDEWLDWFRRNAADDPNAQTEHTSVPYKHIFIQKLEDHDEDPRDFAAQAFLNILDELRTVILQDSVLLRREFPHHPLWKDPLFARADYLEFAAQVQHTMQLKEQPQVQRVEEPLLQRGQEASLQRIQESSSQRAPGPLVDRPEAPHVARVREVLPDIQRQLDDLQQTMAQSTKTLLDSLERLEQNFEAKFESIFNTPFNIRFQRPSPSNA